LWNIKLTKYTNTLDKAFLSYSTVTDDFLLDASRRFALRTCLYVDPLTLDETAANSHKLKPAATGITTAITTIFNQLDAHFVTATSLDVSNISLFGRLLTLAEASTPIDELFVNCTFNDALGITVAPTSSGSATFDVIIKQHDNYAVYLDKSKNTVKSGLLHLNGQPRFDERDGTYFNYIQPYQHHTNTPADGINVYSFALHPENPTPSGTCNFSRIDSSVLKLTLDDAFIGSSTSVVNADISVYALNYNILRIVGGMGGLAYAS